MSNISLLKLTVYGITLTVMGLASTGCSNSRWEEKAANPHTGDAMAERQLPPPPSRPLRQNQTVFTGPDRLIVRKHPDQPAAEAPEVLEQNTELKIVDPAPVGKDGQIEVVHIDTRTPDVKPEPVFVPKDYVSEKPVVPTIEQASANRYFMVQNIATEKVRVYERCTRALRNGDCPHRLVLETDMSAGEDTPDKSRQTILGSYRISAWFKFYEDQKNLFPSWYRAYYPEVPPPGAPIEAWLSHSLMPDDRGKMRGSFGWYTAHLEPDAQAQWTHGTFGWGKDGGRFIDLVRDAKINEMMDPRSMGCTRVENQAIAWMREKLPVGTTVVKVYAKESYGDSNLNRYQAFELTHWDWILTRSGVNESGAMSADANRVRRAGEEANSLESGTYTPVQVPHAVALTGERNGSIDANGNLYNLPLSSFKGVFLVDEGRFEGYVHPAELRISGQIPHILPPSLRK
jgi:hypothetical protein